MKLAVIGTGYVGLVTGTCFAETGNQVTCVDIDEDKISRMQNGEVPIFEPGLELLFERNTEQGRLRFTSDIKSAVRESEIIFLALPTPPGEDGSADLSYILGVAHQIAPMIRDYKVIVDKSTVPVGTAEKVHAIMAESVSEDFFDVVSNPEFLREGVAVEDFLKPDRVIIGTESKRAREVMKRLYEPFVRQGNPVLFMDARSAEMTKYAANAYLATRITFMNEIANLCEELGANVDWVRQGIGSDSRIGKRFLFPGVGFGGSCFPKDVQALARMADQNQYSFDILRSVMQVNTRQRVKLVEKIRNYFDNNLKGKTIAIWGLAFKPNTDDIREAPSLYTIDELLQAGVKIRVYDPEAMENIKKHYGDKLSYGTNQYEILEGADALAILTEWSVFRTPDFDQLKKSMKKPVIFDGRNLYGLKEMAAFGFYYESIGRQVVNEATDVGVKAHK